MINVVGLDLSLTAVGYCHPDGRTETISSRRRGVERLCDLRGQIADGLSADRAQLVVLEDYAFSRAASHAHELGELGGVVKVGLLAAGYPSMLVGPSSLKKFATGRGNANKIAMAVAAAKVGREFADDNQCDAWWLWQMAMYRYALAPVIATPERSERVAAHTAYRDESVSKIEWPVLAESLT